MCQVPCTCLCLSAKFPGPRPRPKVLLPPPPPPTHQVFLPTQLQLKWRADLTLAYLLSCAHLASLAAERASWNVFVDKHSHESFLVTVPHPQHSTPPSPSDQLPFHPPTLLRFAWFAYVCVCILVALFIPFTLALSGYITFRAIYATQSDIWFWKSFYRINKYFIF